VSGTRSPWGARLDRWLTGALRVGGRFVGRPSEPLLHELTGRSKGGPEAEGQGSARAQAFSTMLADGRRALQDGHFGEALALFAQAAERDPADPWPWHGRGDALQLSGQYADALDAYRASLERAPDLALSHCGAGNALEGLRQISEAREAWDRALALDPDNTWAAEGLARTGGCGYRD